MHACKYRVIKDKSGNKTMVVYMLSTCDQPIMELIDKLDKDANIVMKPRMVKSYNSHMG